MTNPNAGNAKHQAAAEATALLVEQLRIDIHTSLHALAGLHRQLGDLTDTRQSIGLGFITPEGMEARGRQDAADRLASRSAICGSAEVGHAWMNAPAGSIPGVHPAPVTMPVVSADAEVLFTLQHHVRRLAPRAVTAARNVEAQTTAMRSACPWPRIPLLHTPPTTDVDVLRLIEHLGRIVDVWSDRKGLQDLLRDLDRLERLTGDVIDGPAKTNWPDPCPWCGHHSLVVHHRAPGRTEMFVRCDGRHDCRCDDEWCECRRPTQRLERHRHEWINSGRAKNPVDGRAPYALTRLIAHRKDQTLLETKATAARERALELHTEIPIYRWAADCPSPDEHRSHWVLATAEGIADDLLCEACGPIGTCCDACSHIATEAPVPYPCDTVRALDLDQPDND